MPPRDNPTARQARLGAELRKLRERAGMPAREAGALLGVNQARISNIESGRIGVSEERIRRLATFYACDDEKLLDALCAMTREHRGQFWWDEYRGVLHPAFLDIAELEHHARYLRSMHAITLPGLLQVEDYARVLFSSVVTALPSEEIEARVAHRLRRQALLDQENPPPLDLIIHEAALRMRLGGRKVMRRQLENLLDGSERPGVAIRVLPFGNERFVEVIQILYAGGVVPQLDTVQMDTHLGSSYWDVEAELRRHETLLSIAEDSALEVEASRDLIRRITQEL